MEEAQSPAHLRREAHVLRGQRTCSGERMRVGTRARAWYEEGRVESRVVVDALFSGMQVGVRGGGMLSGLCARDEARGGTSSAHCTIKPCILRHSSSDRSVGASTCAAFWQKFRMESYSLRDRKAKCSALDCGGMKSQLHCQSGGQAGFLLLRRTVSCCDTASVIAQTSVEGFSEHAMHPRWDSMKGCRTGLESFSQSAKADRLCSHKLMMRNFVFTPAHVAAYRGTSLIKNTHPPRITIGP